MNFPKKELTVKKQYLKLYMKHKKKFVYIYHNVKKNIPYKIQKSFSINGATIKALWEVYGICILGYNFEYEVYIFC